jgi:phosphoglycerate dehydrogenase-like enzyme
MSNASAFLLRGKPMGLIGYGNLGRALVPLLRPFGCSIHVHDPWLPDNYLREEGLHPATLSGVLSESKVIFVLAGATSENRAMLGAKELNEIANGAVFVLASRASLVDFDALTEHLKSGRFSAAIDVFPEEPFAAYHPIRNLPNVVLSAHRAGGIAESYQVMGEMVVDDLSLVLRGLSPVRLQKASRETVGRMQSKPVG